MSNLNVGDNEDVDDDLSEESTDDSDSQSTEGSEKCA